MVAIGCLLSLVMLVGGTLMGAMLGGGRGALWGGVSGLALGLAVPAVMAFALVAARRKR